MRAVRPRGVAAQNAQGVAKVGASPEHGVHEGTDGLEVAGAEGGGGLVVLRRNNELQVRLHRRWGGSTVGVAKAEQDILEVRALGREGSAIRSAMHLDAQDDLGFADILDAILAFEAILDPLDLVQVRRDEEEVVDVGGDVVRVSPLAADVDAGVRLGALVAKSLGRVDPVIPDAACLLEAVQRAIEFEDLAGVLAAVDAFWYAHVQLLLECAVEVRLVDVGLMDMKAVAGGKSE